MAGGAFPDLISVSHIQRDSSFLASPVSVFLHHFGVHANCSIEAVAVPEAIKPQRRDPRRGAVVYQPIEDDAFAIVVSLHTMMKIGVRLPEHDADFCH